MENKDLCELIVEIYRLRNSYENLINKVENINLEKKKNQNILRFFDKKLLNILQGNNITIVDLTGKEYDFGMAVTPLNLEDFKEENNLFIEQMLEPIIIKDSVVIKQGICLLNKNYNNEEIK